MSIFRESVQRKHISDEISILLIIFITSKRLNSQHCIQFYGRAFQDLTIANLSETKRRDFGCIKISKILIFSQSKLITNLLPEEKTLNFE
jgi:hypothetical protein